MSVANNTGANATMSVAKPMSEKASAWSITINNPNDDDLRQWESLKGLHWVREVTGQLEQGENGTPHIQGCLKTTHVRFSQVKRALPRAHIEPARSVAALERYVVKAATRVAPIPTTKVATQADVQRRLYQLTCSTLGLDTNHTNPTQIEQAIRDMEARIWTAMDYKGNSNHFAISMVNQAVSSFVRDGYYGIEFVMSNGQVRSAFVTHFSAIVIREHHANRLQAQSNATQQAPQAESADEAPYADEA